MMTLEVTPAQQERTEAMFREMARGEQIEIERVSGCWYVYGSELACLRILAKYHANGVVANPKARVGFSTNMSTWYFVLET